ncbi:DUF308 domain-containing protein [Glaciibacter sp. 2TAF33]|uniref:DUF308 domain-containing protein n=1 Tax=Glaciibacter sp. 2TAF33 TaxID=3233015 RepID=UPI003F8F36D7
MANVPTASALGSRYWSVPILRAVLALIPAVVITFTPDHSAEFGLLAFGTFAVLSGLAVGVLGWRTITDGVFRTLFLLQGIVGVVLGAVALGFHSGGLGLFLYLVSVWGAITGFLELYSGIRLRARNAAAARDWLVVGGATAVLALAFLLLPPHAVVSVGLFGAYLVMLGVFLVIAGLSLKWSTVPARQVAPAVNDSDIS